MKIIDEKGKLFGLINIIDLSVLLVVVLLVVGGASRFKAKPTVTGKLSEALIDFEVSNVRMATVNQIAEGDQVFHYDKGTLIGEVVEVSVEPYKDVIEGDNEWIESEVPNKYIVNFKVKADVKDSQDVIIAGEEQMRVGISYRVKNKKAAFTGTVMDIEVKK